MKYHDCKIPSSGIRPGFTLTGLFFVILIIAVLAALSIIGVIRIRETAEKAVSTCWFQDLEFLASLTGNSPEELEENTLTAILLHMLDPKVVRARKPLHERVYTSHGMNDAGLNPGDDPGLTSSHNINQLSDSARTMAFATATDCRVSYNSRYEWDFVNPNDEKTAMVKPPTAMETRSWWSISTGMSARWAKGTFWKSTNPVEKTISSGSRNHDGSALITGHAFLTSNPATCPGHAGRRETKI